MRPEGGSTLGRFRRGGTRAGREDLLSRAFPLGDWGEPAGAAGRAVPLGRGGRAARRRLVPGRPGCGSGAARGRCATGTAAGVTAGAALPLLELTGALDQARRAGAICGAAGRRLCMACDRYFGLTSGWMRDVATAQAVQRRLETLQFDWASESVREVLGPTEGTASEAAERCLGVLRRFWEDITELVRTETADWMVEFRAGRRRCASSPAGTGRARPQQRDGAGAGSPPGHAGPNMPRQLRPGACRGDQPAAPGGPGAGRLAGSAEDDHRALGQAAGRGRVQAQPDVVLAGEGAVAVGGRAAGSSSVGGAGRRLRGGAAGWPGRCRWQGATNSSSRSSPWLEPSGPPPSRSSSLASGWGSPAARRRRRGRSATPDGTAARWTRTSPAAARSRRPVRRRASPPGRYSWSR